MDDKKKLKELLNLFYVVHMRKHGISGEQYKEMLEKELEAYPMDAEYKEVHNAQRKIMRNLKLS